MLGTALSVVPDVGDVVNVNGQQHELANHRLPPEAGRSGGGVPPLNLEIELLAHGTAQHDLGVGRAAGDDTVQQNPRIMADIQRLGRGWHHRQPQLTVHDQRLDAADPRGAIAPCRADQQHTRPDEFIVHHRGQKGLSGGNVRPSHDPCLLHATDIPPGQTGNQLRLAARL
ncbi:MAG TPA: hypothetical protein VHU92_06695 [Streptosporangiaceae bacterium]|nr:hypothetical protein [Streptosporangiaceae bacterium]